MLKTIILIVVVYLVAQCVYVYNTDAKLRAKIKDKSWGETIGALLSKVIDNHKFWYKDSDLEDVVEDIKKDGAKVVAKAKVKGAELIADAKEEATEVVAVAKKTVAKAKAEVAKAKAKAAPAKKSAAKAPAKVNKSAPKAKTATKKK
jgi:hypothetical protein